MCRYVKEFGNLVTDRARTEAETDNQRDQGQKNEKKCREVGKDCIRGKGYEGIYFEQMSKSMKLTCGDISTYENFNRCEE